MNSDRQRRDFLEQLDNAEMEVTDWEARFLESNLGRDFFSDAQRQVIDQMMERYGERIGW